MSVNKLNTLNNEHKQKTQELKKEIKTRKEYINNDKK